MNCTHCFLGLYMVMYLQACQCASSGLQNASIRSKPLNSPYSVQMIFHSDNLSCCDLWVVEFFTPLTFVGASFGSCTNGYCLQ